ncbi:hypothetical protein [Membranihabitans maritimus]|uniref:hypothetical protein n=1 Tax=Membranihabitans maritimus TaxID=2904244 RepID=UPI001F29AC59|nr:hypothetical protein [Membranihabitans maritimus]
MPKRNSINIKAEHLDFWFGATGFYLPRTENELRHFNKLYADYEFELDSENIKFEDVWKGNIKRKKIKTLRPTGVKSFKMAARGFKDLPEEIRAKIIRNQRKNEQE